MICKICQRSYAGLECSNADVEFAQRPYPETMTGTQREAEIRFLLTRRFYGWCFARRLKRVSQLVGRKLSTTEMTLRELPKLIQESKETYLSQDEFMLMLTGKTRNKTQIFELE